MKIFLFYLITVLIWGTTWITLHSQITGIEPAVSILYRFTLAATLMHIWCRVRNIALSFNIKQHLFLFLMGVFMFSIHYIFIYKSTAYIMSGMVALVFSMVSLFNIVNSYIFFKKKPSSKTIIGALLGVVGIGTFFWHEILSSITHTQTLTGLALSLTGTLLFSIGNMTSRHCQDQGMLLVPSITVSMTYGALIMLIYTSIESYDFILPQSSTYWLCLLYLAIPGSIVAFLAYLRLIKLLTPEQAGYATVIFPIVALTVSWLFEGYHWSITDFVALGIALTGNILVMRPKRLGANRC